VDAVMGRILPMRAILQHGSALSRGKARPAASQGFSESANVATPRRTLLIHGARATMHTLSKSQTRLGEWLRKLLARAHFNVVVVALANKLARLAWATMRRDTDFAHQQLAAA